MGRGKVTVKRIEERVSRQVTFSKRKSGLLKKARELSVLCGVEVAVILFSESGNLFQFCSKDSVKETLDRYLAYKREHPASIIIKKHRKGSKALRSFDNLLQLLQRHFQEERLKLLNADQFTQLEDQMESLLRQTRVKKMNLLLETVSKLRQKGKEVEEENSQLRKEITAIQNERNRTDLQNQVIVNPSTPEPQGLLHFL